MSTPIETGRKAGEAAPRDLPQLGLAALLAVIGAFTVYDASTLEVGFADPVGPRVFPYVVGVVMIVLAALLVVATLRGDRPEEEGGEDVDLTHPADWGTVLKLVAVMVFTIATINLLGWAISGALLFAGAAWALGSRTLLKDLLVGAVLSVASWYAFYVGLGIPLGAGLLDGVL
ncbi:MAG TPA: tripartite tricarboxylate transporter TctB family protein [Nocardioides sp.]|jgi:putative tricarboxylic transport membrane protein|nr:tripartite tricarboxylate transporter TctB family protein [Nocardioides sp.]